MLRGLFYITITLPIAIFFVYTIMDIRDCHSKHGIMIQQLFAPAICVKNLEVVK